MKTPLLKILLIGFVFFISCDDKKNPASESRFKVVAEDRNEPPTAEMTVNFAAPATLSASSDFKYDIDETKPSANQDVNKKKLIKDGTLSVKSVDISASKKGLDDLVKKYNGYYERENLDNNDQRISYDLKIRVPADNFEKLIATLETGKDEIVNKSIQARDVTEEYMDLETRLKNKREYLVRYRELLKKAITVKDIMAIEENVRVLQEEIESTEGRLKYMSDQVTFSNLDINLFQLKEFIYKPQPKDKFSERVKKSISNGWASCVDFVLWIITIWPYALLITLIIIVIRRRRKKRD